MSNRSPSHFINDILSSIDRVVNYTSKISFEEFSANYMMQEACLYNIQVIGEAVSRLPNEFKDKEPGIPWGLIKGMRNRLIHDYFGTDLELVWNVINQELPSLKTKLKDLRLNP